ncbi:MAG: SDR family oxidoreductase [Kangiellaceae bacterium]|nr:SDR family oxidoreductase [Kangiellaceae bacterium]
MITGAATGIGAATAKLLAHKAENLILHTGRNRESLSELALTIENCSTHLAIGDLANGSTFDELTAIVEKLGALDVVISNAGFPEWSKFGELSDESLQRSLDINVKAFHNIITRFLTKLENSKSARVIAISSFLAHRFQLDDTYVPAAAASKAALEGLVKSLAMQLAPSKIPVNAVVPGYIKKDGPNHTPPSKAVLDKLLGRIPMGRLGLPGEVAALIDFLTSDSAQYITGQCIAIDGGLTV